MLSIANSHQDIDCLSISFICREHVLVCKLCKQGHTADGDVRVGVLEHFNESLYALELDEL